MSNERAAGASGGRAVGIVADGDVIDRYARWLDDRWRAVTGSGPGQAMTVVDREPPVLVLDRSLRSIHADRLLGMVRESGLDTRVVMLTDVEPGSDPLRLGFDDYLVKPVGESTLVETVAGALCRATYQRRLSRLYDLATRKAELEAERPRSALADDETYRRLRENITTARSQVMDAFERLDDDDVTKLCTELDRFDGGVHDPMPRA